MAPMTKKKTIGQEIAENNARVNSGAQEKWVMDTETGAIELKLDRSMIQSMGTKRPVFMMDEDNKKVAYIQPLASGFSSSRASVGGGRSAFADFWFDEDNFAMWGNPRSYNFEKREMARAMYWWRRDSLVYKCVKLLSQMANSHIIFSCPDEPTQYLVKTWFEQAMPPSFRNQWFMEYFRTGLVAAMKLLVEYKPREFRQNRTPLTNKDGKVRAIAKANEDATAELVKRNEQAKAAYEKEHKLLIDLIAQMKEGKCDEATVKTQASTVLQLQSEWKKGMIPAFYTMLNPMLIFIKGPNGLEFLRQPYLLIDGLAIEAVKDPSLAQEAYVNALPDDIKRQVQDGKSEVWLPPSICSITYADKLDYERYPTPMISHAFEALEMKQLLIQADKRTAESVKEKILKVTIGNDLNPVIDPSEIMQVQQIFNSPSRHLTLFWNHTLSVEWVKTDLEGFMDPKKYMVWDDMIRTCFGISRVFTGTSESSGAIGNSMMNFEGLKTEILTVQSMFMEMLNKELHMLRQALGLKHDVTARFVNIFGDIVEFITALNAMVTNGTIDPETVHDVLNITDIQTVEARLRKYKKMQTKSEIFMPMPSANNMGPKQGLKTGGRPSKTGKKANTQKKGKSQPKTKVKASCKLMIPEPDEIRLVVDMPTIDDADRTHLALAFRLGEPEMVMTTAEYQEAYGVEVKMIPHLPDLDVNDIAKCAFETPTVCGQINAMARDLSSKWKDENPGKNMTAARKAEIEEQAIETVLAPMRVDDTWNDRLTDEMKALGDMPKLHKITYASVMLKSRYDKLAAEKSKAQ